MMAKRLVNSLFFTAVMVGVLGLSGCASFIALLSGNTVSVEDLEITSFEAELVPEDGFCPTGRGGLIVKAHIVDGEVEYTQGAGEGRMRWEDFEVQSVGPVTMYEEGWVEFGENPHAVLAAEEISFYIVSRHHELAPMRVDVPPRFDCTYRANLSGEAGRHGADGQSGRNGARGTSNQSSGSYAQPGGHGENGGHGGNGADGEAGRSGNDVEVFVSLVEGSDPVLLEVRVESQTSHHNFFHIVDPSGGGLEVIARGGNGGNGGNGGGGGSGGGGGTGDPAGNGGDGGSGGDGGNGADGGDGGTVTFYLSAEAEPYMGIFSADTSGGVGGSAGSAGFGGSYGTTYSGGTQGRRGERGRDGTRNGRHGRDGPPPKFVIGD